MPDDLNRQLEDQLRRMRGLERGMNVEGEAGFRLALIQLLSELVDVARSIDETLKKQSAER